MRAGEQLFGRLAKLQDLCQHGDSLIGVLNACQTDRGETLGQRGGMSIWKYSRWIFFSVPVTVDPALIGQWVKHLERKTMR